MLTIGSVIISPVPVVALGSSMAESGSNDHDHTTRVVAITTTMIALW